MFWSPDDPAHPSTITADQLVGDSHLGIRSASLLVAPSAAYGASGRPFEPSRVMVLGVDSYEVGGLSPTHVHPDKEKVYVVLAGQAKITVGDDSRVLGPSGMAFAPVDVPHSFENVGGEVLVIGAVFAFVEDPARPR